MSILLAALAALLFGCGTWLLLQRRLTRIIIGVGLLGHGANLLLVTAGGPGGRSPLIGSDEVGVGGFADPLPQALALTAIVITFGITAFLLALGYRSWQITRDDAVEDDVEDRLVARAELHAAEGDEDADSADGDPPADTVDDEHGRADSANLADAPDAPRSGP